MFDPLDVDSLVIVNTDSKTIATIVYVFKDGRKMIRVSRTSKMADTLSISTWDML